MHKLSATQYNTLDYLTVETWIAPDRQWPTAPLFNLPLVQAGRDEIARHIVALSQSETKTSINFINAHCINVSRKDKEYCAALYSSDLLLPDGVGIEIAAKMQGQELADNLNGTDLFPDLCAYAQERSASIFLLGGNPGVAEDAGEWAQAQYEGLKISGTHSGYFDKAEEEALIAQINASRSSLLLVGLGVPLQEKWIERNRDRLDVPVAMGVGGLFDYYAGRIPRAPAVVRRFKSEWVWRLAMEPRRMAKRYLWGNAAFLSYAALEAARLSQFRKSANLGAKRGIDILVSLAMILCLLPLFILTAAAIWLEDKGPVFFKQTRIGADGSPFKMIKFRSMYQDAEARRAALIAQSDRSGTCFKMREDPRITRAGKFIRRFSIDELPQLFNVLSGSMALVGPRPALPGEVVNYEGRQWQRLYGKPGITCTWQVNGRAEIPFARQAIMDRAYLKRVSVWVDIKLLLSTPRAVLGGRGAY
ncbi:MAG: WecB/TagA/CpsF family glycosyltransferase [Marinomonas sp.]